VNAATLRTRWERLPPLLIDIGLCLAVATTNTIAISIAREPGSNAPDALAYALGLIIAALLIFRRRRPVAVLLTSFVALTVYYSLDYPGISAAVPLAVALYTAVAAGHLRWSLGVAAWYLVGGFVVAVFVDVESSLIPTLNDLVRDGALLLAVLLFGSAVRSHRALMAETSARLRRADEDRKREAQELEAAQVIQKQFLPGEPPTPSGWNISTHYQPARAVGGDFYDFLELPDGRVAVVIGDATDKGIPAALVMATTHGILRGEGSGLQSPGAVLERANDRLYPQIPAHMFVTCLYALLDPSTGRLVYANAGHNLPMVATADGAGELRARGMPLGAMPGMTYEQKEAHVNPGDCILFHSDGLIEAHNAAHEMFGLPRLQKVVESGKRDELIAECLDELKAFVGNDWEQEDDITLLSLQRTTTSA
jgi:serine phosphatase RsbU (regulator of sigma subunit)